MQALGYMDFFFCCCCCIKSECFSLLISQNELTLIVTMRRIIMIIMTALALAGLTRRCVCVANRMFPYNVPAYPFTFQLRPPTNLSCIHPHHPQQYVITVCFNQRLFTLFNLQILYFVSATNPFASSQIIQLLDL